MTREFRCGPIVVEAPERCCLFCGLCTDVLWDCTHGPYMVMCWVGGDIVAGLSGECGSFTD